MINWELWIESKENGRIEQVQCTQKVLSINRKMDLYGLCILTVESSTYLA